MSNLSSRERVMRALSRQVPDRVPKDLSWGLSPQGLNEFRKRTGESDPNEYFGVDVRMAVMGKEIESDIVKFDLAREGSAHRLLLERTLLDRFRPWLGALPAAAEITEWGVGYVQGSVSHFHRLIHPLRQVKGAAELSAYPFPDFSEPWRQEALRLQVQAWHARRLAVAGKCSPSVFTTCCLLRGMEEFLSDLIADPRLARELIERVAGTKRRMAIQYALAGVDVLVLGSTVASQQGMLISPKMWRHWFKPRYQAIIGAARSERPELRVAYISQGKMEEILPDLIEIGVDVLSSVQPECMDPVALKRLYGDQVAFWGTVSVQKTLPLGTAAEVRAEVRQRIATVGANGGLLIGPSHIPGPDVPLANIFAYFDAVEEFGAYERQ